MKKYAIEIFYSVEDEGFIALVPELPGCSASGNTDEAALKAVKIAIELWLGVAEKEGRQIPQPRGKELLTTLYETVLGTASPQKA
ncbi:MAG: type II toxin-antitoxin system HicB family antitoxin [Methanomicrobia archaeon]|nr:type II toxin-antitoxin system HicB family antitoxin [Methanomicrobia archaeon]